MNGKKANSKAIFQALRSQLQIADGDEAQAIAWAIMAHFTGLTRTEVMSEKEIDQPDFSTVIERVNQHEPLQYILGIADFSGRRFQVSPAVLIPRPETELLVQEALQTTPPSARILDIGTGSGCIAITLSLGIAGSIVHALDVSAVALEIAAANATKWNAPIAFLHQNFLTEDLALAPVDLIVSNPPYVRQSEASSIEKNVLDYEPHLALFVPDDDALIFYHAIARQGNRLLRPAGKIIVEINAAFGNEVCDLFQQMGYHRVRRQRDLDGKDRVVVAHRAD